MRNSLSLSIVSKSSVCALFLSLVGIASPSYAQNLVTNGTFESGLTGWTCTISNQGACFTTSTFPSPPDGNTAFRGWENLTPPLGNVKQLLTTAPGGTYNISFYFATLFGGSPPNALSLEVGSLSVPLNLSASNIWSSFSGTFTATGSSTPLTFSFKTINGSGTLGLDTVVVTEVPGPLPLLGATAAFGYSRKLRKRWKDNKITVASRLA
jgi:hypothetical protein